MSLTNRQTIAATLRTAPVPRSFVHAEPAGRPTPPDGAFEFTADAGTDLLSTTAHGLTAGIALRFATSGTLPAGLSPATTYYVIASGLTADAFKVSATLGGSAVNITGAGSGTHTWSRYLTTEEQSEVDAIKAYLTNGTGPLPPDPVLPGSVALITAFAAYHQSAAYKTWWHDDQLSREAQFQLRRADMFSANDATVPPSADEDGLPDAPPTSPVPRDPL